MPVTYDASLEHSISPLTMPFPVMPSESESERSLPPPAAEGPGRKASDFFHVISKLPAPGGIVLRAKDEAPARSTDPAIDLDDYACICAELAEPGARRVKVLAAHELDAAAWRRADQHYRKAMEREGRRGERAMRERFDEAYVLTWEVQHPERFDVQHYARLQHAQQRGLLLGELEEQGLEAPLRGAAPARVEEARRRRREAPRGSSSAPSLRCGHRPPSERLRLYAAWSSSSEISAARRPASAAPSSPSRGSRRSACRPSLREALRRRAARAHEEVPREDLAAVRVAGELEADAVRGGLDDLLGLMREEHELARASRPASARSRSAPWPWPKRRARRSRRRPRDRSSRRRSPIETRSLRSTRMPSARQLRDPLVGAGVVLVVAGDEEDAVLGPQARERRDVSARAAATEPSTRSPVIAIDVGLEGVHALDHAARASALPMRRTDVHVGELHDAEAGERPGQAAEGDADLLDGDRAQGAWAPTPARRQGQRADDPGDAPGEEGAPLGIERAGGEARDGVHTAADELRAEEHEEEEDGNAHPAEDHPGDGARGGLGEDPGQPHPGGQEQGEPDEHHLAPALPGGAEVGPSHQAVPDVIVDAADDQGED